jgi:hypothetical protein
MSSFIDYPVVPLIYPQTGGLQNQYTNVLLIDCDVSDYQIFVDSVNSDTFPIVYSVNSLKTELLSVLQSNFTTISRIGIVFTSSAGFPKTFLNCKYFCNDSETEPYSENLQFIINIINDFQVQNIDYLACDTLSYSNWSNYYQLLTQTTGVIVGASNDKTGNIKYGGDWVLESTSQDVESIYFTQNIEYYTYLLDNVTPWVSVSNRCWFMVILGNYMYVSCFGNGGITRVNLTTLAIDVNYVTSSSNCGIVTDGTYLYVANYGGTITKVNVTNASTTTIISGLYRPLGLVISGTYLYAIQENGTLQRIDLTNNTYTSIVTGLASSYGLAMSGNYLYSAFHTSSGYIQRINLADNSFTTFATGFNIPSGLAVSGNYLYVANSGGGGSVSQVNLSTGTSVVYTTFTGSKQLEGMYVYGNILYAGSVDTNEIFQLALPSLTSSSIQCFKKDTYILTDKRYRPVQDLRPGDLVKTLRNGFVPIYTIGKRDIFHPASSKRIKEQLYKCSKAKYPDIFETLIITGCHSILIDDFVSEEQKQKAIEVNENRLCITDGKYRLPACADLRASVYEKPGTYTIYHFALENEDYYMNYGIYANGLLVETSSKRYMKELSGMELIPK